METIGIMGSGVMGLTVARRILEAGYTLVVHDKIAGAMEKAEKIGAVCADSPQAAASMADIILMLLPGPVEVEECVSGDRGLLSGARPEMVIVDMSTIDPVTTRRMARLAEQRDVSYLDAPVLGRPATVGMWALPVGGSATAIERCRPIFHCFAKNVIHIGDSGSGHKVKLLNQLMFGAINAMTAEMMAIASRVGVSPAVLYDTLTASQAGTISNLFKELGRRVAVEDYADPTFTVDLLIKDVKLAVQMACDHDAPPILGRTIDWINEVSRAQGHGKEDTSVMWRTFLRIWSGKSA